MQFAVFDAAAGGSPIGSALMADAIAVSNGLFTVTLDFGAGVFTGADRWLNLSVKTNGAVSFTPLTPRQQITSTPYAVQALGAGSAATVTGNISASQITGTLAASNIGAGTITSSMLAAGSVTSNSLAVGAAAANLNAISQSGVASGGLVLSATENTALLNAGGRFPLGIGALPSAGSASPGFCQATARLSPPPPSFIRASM